MCSSYSKCSLESYSSSSQIISLILDIHKPYLLERIPVAVSIIDTVHLFEPNLTLHGWCVLFGSNCSGGVLNCTKKSCLGLSAAQVVTPR